MKAKARKLGIHFAHYECMGHTSRAMAIGEVFKKRFPQGDLFFIQAGLAQPLARTDQVARIYALPAPFVSRDNFKKASGIGRDTQLRARVGSEIIALERPELLVTEFFPLGREEFRHELIPVLVKAAKQGCALWAAAGYSLLTALHGDWRDKVLELYQKIIIFSPPAEKDFMVQTLLQPEDRLRYLDFFKRHEAKIRFAGYLLPAQEVVRDDEDENLPKPPVPAGACRVSVLRGGGAVYPKMIAQAIRASDLLGKEYYLTVVAGPATSQEEWYFFVTLVRKKLVNNLLLLRAVGDYEGLIKASDICVSGAGYHSAAMLLKYRKKAVIIPFEGYGEKAVAEQPARANMLAQRIGVNVLSIHKATSETLAEAIRRVAGQSSVKTQITAEEFRGAEVLDQEMRGLFGP